MIASESLARLRAVDLPALVADYVPLRKSSQQRWTGRCPFHKERTASFTVYADHFYCFGCAASGSAVDFVMRMERMPFPRAAEAVALRFGVSLDAKPDALTRQQRQAAAQEAEFCKWWWARWESGTLAAMHAALDADDEDFAGCVSRILYQYRNMPTMERYGYFQRTATAEDRKEWREHVHYEREFAEAWMGLSKGGLNERESSTI
jgi:hypothetical protein